MRYMHIAGLSWERSCRQWHPNLPLECGGKDAQVGLVCDLSFNLDQHHLSGPVSPAFGTWGPIQRLSELIYSMGCGYGSSFR